MGARVLFGEGEGAVFDASSEIDQIPSSIKMIF